MNGSAERFAASGNDVIDLNPAEFGLVSDRWFRDFKGDCRTESEKRTSDDTITEVLRGENDVSKPRFLQVMKYLYTGEKKNCLVRLYHGRID